MEKMCKFPEIYQFRQVFNSISNKVRYVGRDDDNNPIFDNTIKLPTLTFIGTVKLHGTNAGVTLSKNGNMYPQSRENIISIENDNAGFAKFVYSNEQVFRDLFKTLNFEDSDYITIFGEWSGKGIQKDVAINQLEKMFVIFDVKLSYNDENKNSKYLSDNEFKHLKNHDFRIFNILDFKTYSIDIDFENPTLTQNKLTELMLDVENECPVAKYFGVSGTGEGIVWKTIFQNDVFRFKVKGEKHGGKSKVKVIKTVDNEIIDKIQRVAFKVTPIWRLSQMLDKSCNLMNGGNIDRSKLGVYIKMVIEDIIKEDIDIILDEGLTLKDVNKYISDIARKYFFEQESIF